MTLSHQPFERPGWQAYIMRPGSYFFLLDFPFLFLCLGTMTYIESSLLHCHHLVLGVPGELWVTTLPP